MWRDGAIGATDICAIINTSDQIAKVSKEFCGKMESLLKKSDYTAVNVGDVNDHTAIGVSDDVYEMLMRSYAAAPKKKVWKETLCDKWGTKSRVRFEGGLVNWSLLHHKWVPILPYGSLCDPVPTSGVGEAIAAGEDPNAAVETAVDANYTGNHYRNHRVRVPKSVYGCA